MFLGLYQSLTNNLKHKYNNKNCVAKEISWWLEGSWNPCLVKKVVSVVSLDPWHRRCLMLSKLSPSFLTCVIFFKKFTLAAFAQLLQGNCSWSRSQMILYFFNQMSFPSFVLIDLSAAFNITNHLLFLQILCSLCF